MTKQTIKATPRDIVGRKVKKIRSEGLIPASIFGKNIQTQNLTLSLKDFLKLYHQVGESGLVYLQISGQKAEIPVIFSDVSIQPVSEQVLHVSLRQVNLAEKIKAPVKIELVGKAPAVADGLGVLVQQADELEVEALPQDFPENITLDVSGLTEVNSAIMVKDLKLGSKLSVLIDPESIIVKIDPLAKEEVAPVVAAEVPVAEGETPTPATQSTADTPEDKK